MIAPHQGTDTRGEANTQLSFHEHATADFMKEATIGDIALFV
jgi:hypothetical protein